MALKAGKGSDSGNGPTSRRLEIREAAKPAAVASLRHQASAFAVAHGAGPELAADIALAVSEAATNAVKYAYSTDGTGAAADGADGAGAVELAAAAEDGWLEVRVRDRGAGFGSGSSDGLGLGLSIMASLSAEMTIVQEGAGTEVRLRFPLPRAAQTGS